MAPPLKAPTPASQSARCFLLAALPLPGVVSAGTRLGGTAWAGTPSAGTARSEEHTSELQSPRDLPSSPTRRSSDLARCFLLAALPLPGVVSAGTRLGGTAWAGTPSAGTA